ncbi:hypothetical protein MHYP_G00002300 [Metynnis hypsauchen]
MFQHSISWVIYSKYPHCCQGYGKADSFYWPDCIRADVEHVSPEPRPHSDLPQLLMTPNSVPLKPKRSCTDSSAGRKPRVLRCARSLLFARKVPSARGRSAPLRRSTPPSSKCPRTAALSALKPGDFRGSCVRRSVWGVKERRPAGAARSGFKTLKNSVLLPWIARV